jgi:hypothetical protein
MTCDDALQLCIALSLDMARCACGAPPGPPYCARCECLVSVISAAWSVSPTATSKEDT